MQYVDTLETDNLRVAITVKYFNGIHNMNKIA
jgi:hypothetical protein